MRGWRVGICEECERMPVPILFAHQGLSRGMKVCESCFAAEGIHLEEELPANADQSVVRGKREGKKQNG
jgi:protein-arginine kinase activator protein McsA